MAKLVTATVVEARSLIREALVSLLKSQSYEIVGSSASLDVYDPGAEAPMLVVLGGLPADDAARAAESLRSRWPGTKIAFLFDRVSATDCHKLVESEINGCIPLFASPATLRETLQQIVDSDLRVMVLKAEAGSSAPVPAARPEARSEPVPIQDAARAPVRSIAPVFSWGLSTREGEILQGLARGHSNKAIARTCGISDATIKVHMKSIFRKLGVGNRTQAAIRAIEQSA